MSSIFERDVDYLLALEAAAVVNAKEQLKEPQTESTATYWLSIISNLTLGDIVSWKFYHDKNGW